MPAQESGVPLRLTLPPDLSRLPEVRAWAWEAGTCASLPESRIFDLQVTVSEATANAIEHAASAVELTAWLLPDRLIVEVTNDGVFQPGLYKDDDHRRRGLGLPLIVSLADQVHVARLGGERTRVSLTFFTAQTDSPAWRTGFLERPASQSYEATKRPATAHYIQKWAWLPVPVLVVLAVLFYAFGLHSVYESVAITSAFNALFVAGPLLVIAYLAARSYLVAGSAYLVPLGAGSLVIGLAFFLAGPLRTAPNVGATVTNVAVLAGSACFLFSAVQHLGANRSVRGRRATIIAAAYLAVLVFVGLLTALAFAGLTPAFVTEQGFTAVRQVVFGVGIAILFLAAGGFFRSFRRVRSPFLMWWYLGLALLASSFVISLVSGSFGSPISWVARGGQWVAGLYLLAGVLSLDRRYGGEPFALERALEESEDRYQRLVEVNPDAVLVIADDKVMFANPAAAVLLGAASPVDLTGKEWLSWVSGESQAVMTESAVATLGGSLMPPREVVLRRTNGDLIDVEATASRIELEGRLAMQVVLRDVTERKQAEEAVRKSEQRLRDLFDNALVGFFETSAEGRVLAANQVCANMFGFADPEEMMAETIDIAGQLYQRPEDRERVLRAADAAVGAPTPVEIPVKRRDGSPCWMLLDVRAARGRSGETSFQGAVRDITERKRTEEELRAQNEELRSGQYNRSLIEAALDPLVTIGIDGKITDVNEATVKITGREREDLIGTDFSDCFTDPEAARRGYLEVFARGQVTDYPLTLRDREGKLTDVLYNASVYKDETDNVLGVFAAARDITQLKELEVQRQIASTLQEALLNIPTELSGVKFGHLYRSATQQAQVGGDFYDVFEVKDNKVALLIGDVAGHGIEAARAATLVKDVVHAFIHQTLRTHEVLRRANRLLIEKDLPGYVTLFMGILDTETGELRYSSAGHPDMLVRRASGEIEHLGSGSSPLGIYADAVWKPHAVELEAHDLLVLFTDGVIEARRSGELFGEKRLESLLKRKPVPPSRLPHVILDQVLAFSEGSLQDDVAILTLLVGENGNGGKANAKPFKQEKLLD
jgi:PAS domain S-box-containing protein